MQNAANWQTVGESPEESTVIINAGSPNGHGASWYISDTSSWEIDNQWISDVRVGQGSGSDGILNIAYIDGLPGTSPISLSRLQIGTQGGVGTVNVYHNDEYVSADHYGSSVLRLQADEERFVLGSGAGSHGTLNVLGSGKSTSMQNSEDTTVFIDHWAGLESAFQIGSASGHGTLNVDGGGVSLSTGNQSRFILGSGTNSSGTVNVLGGGKLSHNIASAQANDVDGMSAILGKDGGRGVLNISGYSERGDQSRAVFGTGLIVGHGANSQGQINITHGGQLVTSNNNYWNSTIEEEAYAPVYLGVNGSSGKAVIDGAGSIWKVIGHSYFYGGTSEVGELHVGQSGTGELTVANGGTLSIGESEYQDGENEELHRYYFYESGHTGGLGVLYLADEAGSQGIINIGASEGQAAQGTGKLDIKEIQLGDGTGTIVFNHTDNSGTYTFNTPLLSGSGQGIIRQVAGATILADQAGYSGDIEVKGGELRINGTQAITDSRVSGGLFNINGHLSANSHTVSGGQMHIGAGAQVDGAITVNGSGLLTGTGKAAGVTIANGGTISPGELGSPEYGDITTDNITFQNGSTYLAHAHPEGQADLIHASAAAGGSGTVTIQDGATVQIEAGAGTWKEQTKTDIGNNRTSNAKTDALHALIYGRTTIGSVDLKGGIGYSKLDTDTSRHIAVPNLVGKSQADYNGGLVQIFAQGSHTFTPGENIQVTPYAGVAYQRLKTDNFTESGSLAALHAASQNHNTTTVGVRANWQINNHVEVGADLGWQHNFGSLTPDANLNFIGANTFNVRGTPMSQDSVLIGVGANFELKENLHLRVGYEGEFGNRSKDNAIKAMLRWSF